MLRHGDLQAGSSFFEVGGTSLTSFAVMHRLREAFALDHDRFPDILIYKYPTVRGLAAHIEHLVSGAADQQPVASGILVTLSRGTDAALPPVFLIASAGGTLGAYEKLARALEDRPRRDRRPGSLHLGRARRDPGVSATGSTSTSTLSGSGSPAGPITSSRIRRRERFGYEIARRLRADDHEVGLLAVVDPFGLDRPTPDSFGYRVMQARFKKPHARLAVRLLGWWRSKVMRRRPDEAE